MALAPLAAYTSAFVMVKKPGPLDDLKVAILQDASSHLWHLAPWPWTIGAIASVALTHAQEFAVTIPGDFLRLERVWVVDDVGAQPLTITGFEQVQTIEGTPKSVAYVVNSGDKLRLNAVYPTGNPNTPTIKSLYKVKAPDLTTAYVTPGALVMPDDYFYVYRSFVLYHAYKFADDPRAGTPTMAYDPASGRTQMQYSGQLGVAMGEAEELRQRIPMIFDLLDTQAALINK